MSNRGSIHVLPGVRTQLFSWYVILGSMAMAVGRPPEVKAGVLDDALAVDVVLDEPAWQTAPATGPTKEH